MEFPTKTTVLIIGGGPVGLFTAISLSQHGIASTIVERHAARTGQPKAHVLNSRSIEILVQAGVSARTLRERGADPSDADVVRFVQSLAGVEYGSMIYERQDEDIKEFTPEPLVNIAQPEIEKVLREATKRSDLIQIWYEHQWQNFSYNAEGDEATSMVLHRTTGKEFQIKSKYLLACDGAHSRARAALNIPLSMPASLFGNEVRYVSVELKADWRKYKSGILWMIMMKNSMSCFIAYDRGSHWVFAFMIDQEAQESQFTEEYCREQVDLAVGEKAEYEILGIQLWTAYLRLADDYRCPNYPYAFVLGDAAHSFPPTGGLGLNTGIGDVQNLVWKIAATEAGWWDHDILGSYSEERRPVAVMSSEQSDLNQFNILKVSTTIATVMDGNPNVGQPSVESQEAIDAVLDEVSEFSDNFNCQVGFVYGSNESIKGNSKYYEHYAVTGGRLPHIAISKDGRTLSTLDLIASQSFVAIASRDIAELPSSLRVGRIPVSILQIGRDFQLEQSKESTLGLGNGRKFLIIRPDQHVAGFASNLEHLKDCISAKATLV